MKTLYDKIWDSHLVVPETDAPAILYIDIHLIHEVTTPQAFTGLKRTRHEGTPHRTRRLATMDHSIPTTSRSLTGFDEIAAKQVRQLEANCTEFGVPLYGLDSSEAGNRSRDWSRTRTSRSPAGRSFVATATRRRTARSARWRTASEQAKSRWCSRRSACCSGNRKISA